MLTVNQMPKFIETITKPGYEPLEEIDGVPWPKMEPGEAFRVFAGGKLYRIFADGRTEGFGGDGPVLIFNRIPALLSRARAER